MTPETILQKIRQESVCSSAEDLWSVIRVSGDDCIDFLHNITTNEIRNLASGSGVRQALLNKKSQIIADFIACRLEDEIWLICERSQERELLDRLDEYRFAEAVEFTVLDTPRWHIHGVKAPAAIGQHIDIPENQLLDPFAIMQTGDSTVMNLPVTGDPGYLVLNSAMPVDAEPVTAADWLQAYRRYAIEGGYPVQREDFDETNLVLELNLGSRLVSITKGCFPGQEVVARVVSRGKIPRKLTPLIFDEAETGASLAGKTLSLDGKTVGQIRRVFYSPGRERSIGVAYLKSNIADTPAPYEFQADESTVACEVDRLPLYLSPVFRKERDKLYNRGMEAYHADAYDEAEVCFRQALDLDRHHADSWEALAMSVEKRGDLDEAIRLNQRYGEADPMAVMAHTNLSRLYMLKGFKEKAEEEQGKAAMVEFKVQAAKKKGSAAETGKRLEQEEAARQKAEAERKMGIFKQVLEMDPEDEIANFGMGKLLLESGQPVRAIEHLQRVVDNNPDYSMAWQLLGQSLIKASKLSEAKEVLNSGLAAAERQGDMMPAKAIKQMLSLL